MTSTYSKRGEDLTDVGILGTSDVVAFIATTLLAYSLYGASQSLSFFFFYIITFSIRALFCKICRSDLRSKDNEINIIPHNKK